MIHRTKYTARGYELDSYGHVNNAVYLNYFEQARWELFRDSKMLDLITSSGLFLVVVDVHIRYQREIRLFDEIEVVTRPKRVDPYLVFEQKMMNITTGLSVSRATIKTVLVDKSRLPQDFPEAMHELY
jgi:YbgC/YbaW family acyl-CoA thioester hydrolase